ncbi:homoserine dehydrogenase [Gudongella sp. SC589]|uniref:homoserine dehydrogenase n=1 Tax=Gudongella sp. SC589 TaxID=3385990 RepID=UPI003904CCF2
MIRIGLVGTGGVGRALMDLVGERDDMKLVFALNSRSGVGDQEGLDPERLCGYLGENRDLSGFGEEGFGVWDIQEVLQRYHVDLLVEATPTDKRTGEPATSTIRVALQNGLHVVTANKGPVMLHYRELKDLANGKGLGFGIGATAGAALPTISAGENDLLGSRLLGIRGVLNGTTNYILHLMETEGVAYTDALRQAQEEGIAETDPSQDVEGWDTAIKMTIIANALAGTDLTLEGAQVTGITQLTGEDIMAAKRDGKRYRLLGELNLEDENPRVVVRPLMVSQEDIFFGVQGKNKGVQYMTDNLGEIAILGGASDVRGAAAAIIRDILQIKKRIFRKV